MEKVGYSGTHLSSQQQQEMQNRRMEIQAGLGKSKTLSPK
jgi:hypothetical protein